MIEKFKAFWDRVWTQKPEAERKRLKSYIPLAMYTFAFVYFVIYLSILNTVNRDKTGDAVKNFFGDDVPHWVKMQRQQEKEIEESYKYTRKRVSGGR